MKNLITYLKALWSRVADSQSTDVSLDCRRSDLRRSPSGLDAKWKQNPFMRFAVVLTLIFTIGSGNVWGGDLTVTLDYEGTGTFPYNSGWSSGGSVSTAQHHGGSQCAQFATTANDVYITYKGNLTNVKSISLWGNRTSNNTTHPTFSVEKSTNNGSTWTEVVAASTFTLAKNSWTQKVIDIPEANRFTGWVRLKYKCGSTAVKFIDDIVITYESSCTSLEMSSVTATPGNAQIVLTWPAVANANSYTVTCKNKSTGVAAGTVGGVSGSETKTCTITGLSNGTEYTWSVMPVGTGSYCADNTPATGDATPNVYYTVTWKNNGSTYTTTSVASGQRPTFPSNPTSCDGTSTTFYGWSTSEWSGKIDDISAKTIYTSAASMPTVSGAVTYYAVFCKGGANGSISITSNDLKSGLGSSYGSGSFTKTISGSNYTFNTYACVQSSTFQMRAADAYIQIPTLPGPITGISSTECHNAGTGNYNGTLRFKSAQAAGNTEDYDLSTKAINATSFSWDISGSYTSGYITTSAGFRLVNLTISYGTPGSKYLTNCCTDPELAYGTGSVTKTFGNGTFKNTLTNSHSVSVTYESNNTDVATVASDGTVTIQGAGNATITARFAGNSTYCADEASYTLTVNKASISPTLTYTPNSVAVGENSSAPTVSGNTGGGGVTYAITSATPSGCATINTSTGVVTGVAVGSVTVTATVAATTNYNGGTATANVTIHAASYFPNGKTIFIQAESSSAWSDANYDCVKAWFHTAGGSETAQTTYWLFDATGGDSGKKLFAAIVPATGDLPYLDIQRFTHDCSSWRNKNGGCSYSDANGSNTIRSTGNTDTKDAQDDYIRWNAAGVTMNLMSSDAWLTPVASMTDQGSGIWSGSYEYTPSNTSTEYVIATNYNGNIGNTGSNNNATLSGMVVGSTYDVTATLDIKDHSLEMSKTFVKGTVHFNLQGHGLAISDLTNVTAGSKISAPSAPSATGYTFGGWYKEPACTNAWTFASDEVNETMTLYAKWTKHNYTITSTLNHCSSSPAIPSSYEYTGSAASLSYTITPSSGYRLPTEITVSGTTYTWNPATGALVLTGIITNNVTITISAVQTHTVDWYVGGSAPANKIGDDGQTTVVDHGGKISDFPATTPDGSACDKVFVGWTNTSSYVHGTSPLFNDVAGSPTINADAQFYAVFAEVNSVSASLTKMTADDDLEVGDKIVIIAQDTRYGMYQASASSYVSYWTTTDMDGEPSLSEIEADDKKYLDVAAGSASNTWKLGDATNGYLYNASSTNLEFSTTNSSDLTLITWTDDSFTLQAGQYISCRTDITGANANKWRGAGASCDPENDNNCSGTEYYYLYKYVPGGTTYTGHTINCADCGSSVTPTYTASPTGGTVSVTKSATPVASGSTVKTCTAVDLTVTITPATHYTLTGFTATGLTTGTATISPAVNTVVPTTSEQTFTVTVSAGATGTLNLTPTFTAQTPLTITLSTNSKGSFTAPTEFPIYAGETFTFPDVTPNDPTCATFVGWIAGTTFVGDGTTHDAPATIAASTVSDPQNSNATYTAVFYETETSESDAYVKVTSTPANWANDHYLIVYEDGGVAFDGSRTDGDGDKIDAASNTVAVSITSSAIAATNALAASEWKIALISGSNYSIQSASGKYIGNASNSNALSTSSSALANTLSISSGDFEVVSDGGAYLRYNATSGQERFRYYKSSSYSSQQAIQLYKLGTAVVETRTYTTNPSCTPKYRVTVASVTGGSPNANPKFNPEGDEVTLTAHPAAGYSFTGWTITHTEGGAAASVTYTTGSASTETAVFEMPAYDVTVTATYAKKMVTELKVMDGSTVVANTTGPVSGTLNVSTGANKTLDVVVTPSDAYDHSWTATVSAGGTYASITNVTDDGFRVNGLAQGDATITVTAPNDEANGGTPKVVTFTVHVTDILPEEIILKRDGSNTPIETLIMYYDASESKGQYVKVNVSYSPSNPTNKAFTFSSAATGKVGSHSHSNNNGYEVLVANGVTTDPVNCTFTSSANGSVTKVLAVTVLPILTDRFVDYVHGNATQTVSARLSADRYTMITDINTPSLSDASDANPTSEDCETAHYHLIGWLPQATAEALMAAGTPITDATEGLVRAGVQVEATGQTWCAIWAEEQ